jgi:L-lactate utilization protein LutB
MQETYQEWLFNSWAQICLKNLKKNGFDALLVSNAEEACKSILDRFSSFDTYGVGGSDTIRKIKILDELRKKGKIVYDHWQDGLSWEENLDIRLKQGRSDCFLCSANAISLTGEIINVDGAGNRNNAMSFGPKKVIIVAGINKIAKDIQAAIERVHEVAAPMRAKSLNMQTPCAETGICSDCNSPQRICRITTILHRRPMLTDISVILINQSLGF